MLYELDCKSATPIWLTITFCPGTQCLWIYPVICGVLLRAFQFNLWCVWWNKNSFPCFAQSVKYCVMILMFWVEF